MNLELRTDDWLATHSYTFPYLAPTEYYTMEHTFLSKVLEGSYNEKDIARVFAEALDQAIYNMMLNDFIQRTGTDINEIMAKAKATMLADFAAAAQQKDIAITDEMAATFENGIDMGAAQISENLGLDGQREATSI
jgi:hypothetical protein